MLETYHVEKRIFENILHFVIRRRRNKMKKNFLSCIFSLLLIGVLTLSACAPKATATPTTEATEAPTQAPTQAPTEAPTEGAAPTLTIWVDTLFAPTIEEISRDFTAKYGVNIVVQPMGMDDVREQTLIAAPAGEGPDIIEGPHDWVGKLVAGGVLAPIDLGAKKDLFVPAAIQAFTYNGKLYGMGLITENVALFRNADLVPDAPKTWDELITTCEKLEAQGIEFCLLLQQGDAYHFFPIQTSFGGYVFGVNPDGNYNPDDVGIDSPGSLAAANWLDMMVKNGHIKAGVDFDTACSLFTGGKAAFYITGPWNLSLFKEKGVHYAISSIPAGTEEAKPFMGVRGLMVSAFSKQPTLAQTYLTEFWATDEAMQKYYEGTLKPPAFLSVLNKVTDPDIAALGQAGLHAMPMPAIPEMSAFWSTMGDAITLIMQQQADPTETFKNAANQIRTKIQEGK
jgi:maltose-binding protein MalE